MEQDRSIRDEMDGRMRREFKEEKISRRTQNETKQNEIKPNRTNRNGNLQNSKHTLIIDWMATDEEWLTKTEFQMLKINNSTLKFFE